MCERSADHRARRTRVWLARGVVVLGGAGAILVLMAGIALADHTCSPGNPEDCRNTAVVIGTVATLTAVLAISVFGLSQWSKEWTPRRCEETMKALDSDIDQALAKARGFLARREEYGRMYAQNPQEVIAQEMASANSQLEELANAVDDLYARRLAVIEGCGSNLKGSWTRAKPAITRGGPAQYIHQVEPPQRRPGPVPIDHLTRREGGGATVDPEAIKTSVDEIIKGGKIPPDFKPIVDALDPRIGSVHFTPIKGGVQVDITGKLGDRFPVSTEGKVELVVQNGELTAKPDYPAPITPFAGKLTDGLDNAVSSFNRQLNEKGLEVKELKVGPDGRLQITTGPR